MLKMALYILTLNCTILCMASVGLQIHFHIINKLYSNLTQGKIASSPLDQKSWLRQNIKIVQAKITLRAPWTPAKLVICLKISLEIYNK